MKLGLVRCLKTEKICNSSHCLEYIVNQEGPMSEVDENFELAAVTTCGGCPGQNVPVRIENMVEDGVEVIVLASCIKLGTPVEFPCPYYEQLKNNILQVDKDLTLFTETHPATFREILVNRIKKNNLTNFFKTGMEV